LNTTGCCPATAGHGARLGEGLACRTSLCPECAYALLAGLYGVDTALTLVGPSLTTPLFSCSHDVANGWGQGGTSSNEGKPAGCNAGHCSE
jgi:hypothetical protein